MIRAELSMNLLALPWPPLRRSSGATFVTYVIAVTALQPGNRRRLKTFLDLVLPFGEHPPGVSDAAG